MANVGDDSVKLDININNEYILKIQEQLQNDNKTCEILKLKKLLEYVITSFEKKCENE